MPISGRKHERADNVGDLEKQILYRFMHKTYLLHPIILAMLLFHVGGLPFLTWGMVCKIPPLKKSDTITTMLSSIRLGLV